jgi:hypothetical protein
LVYLSHGADLRERIQLYDPFKLNLLLAFLLGPPLHLDLFHNSERSYEVENSWYRIGEPTQWVGPQKDLADNAAENLSPAAKKGSLKPARPVSAVFSQRAGRSAIKLGKFLWADLLATFYDLGIANDKMGETYSPQSPRQ